MLMTVNFNKLRIYNHEFLSFERWYRGDLNKVLRQARDIKKILVRIRFVLTKDLLIALLVSSSASVYMSLKNLFKAASPSSFSSFS